MIYLATWADGIEHNIWGLVWEKEEVPNYDEKMNNGSSVKNAMDSIQRIISHQLERV